MKTLQIAGYKNTGKTTLILDFVKLLKQHGYTVAIIKHHHLAEAVPNDTDTGRFFEAGADYTSFNMPGHAVMTERPEKPLTVQLQRFQTEGVDFVLVEGYKKENYSKIILTYSFTEGETDINEIGLTNVLNRFDMRYDMDNAMDWFKEWSNIGDENV
ncbi:Molybdopterin-guanine dinucleotide biosynthesis adapter protein [Jeotgalicoccus saudimassiliensis]|uniref:Molybdopterin-guanine dinucleotide biosynthesis adapter protein n=1 Tax=Jeotgalicoccus saudimassiliensis TaxID=1461582 RepID=A0A078M2A6_9STAP|nr:molybdopterin-guanine dinucleotide biosynthesis protein B [Jeotgalicoccus saudimassiliensis]CDZ98971.1 Molybdopterin-guanine dinucleotide biosynthesis adapter protein [Jeotgalicoccus saudimassiliensis]